MDKRTAKAITKCKHCIFAESNSKQTGCQLGRLEKYIAKGVAIWDNDDQAYIIEAMCNTFRNEEWASYFDDPLAEVKRQIQTRYDVIILSYDDDNCKVNICRTIKNILKQETQPKSWIIALKGEVPNLQELYNSINDLLMDKQFRLVRMVGEKSELDCVDEVFDKVSSMFYMLVDSSLGIELPENYVTRLDDTINNKLRYVSLVYQEDYVTHGLIVQSRLHRMFAGNKGMPIRDKIKEASEIQDVQHMVVEWNNL